MSTMTRFLGFLAVVFLGCIVWADDPSKTNATKANAPRQDTEKPGVEARDAFEALKSMAAEWVADTAGEEHGAHDKDPKVVIRVTAGGSALMETLMPGSDHEMLSVYHLDGDELVMTHYCAAQNQPRLKLNRAKSTAKFLVFEFDGGTNFNPKKDLHIHEATIKIAGDKVEENWVAFKDGKKLATQKILLTKKGAHGH